MCILTKLDYTLEKAKNEYLKIKIDGVSCNNRVVTFQFKYACLYNEIRTESEIENNDFGLLEKNDELKRKGIYLFVSNSKVIYVGCVKERILIKRIKQHFEDNDTGGLRYKLRDSLDLLDLLGQSTLYYLPLDLTAQEIQFKENLLIGLLCPIMNYYKK